MTITPFEYIFLTRFDNFSFLFDTLSSLLQYIKSLVKPKKPLSRPAAPEAPMKISIENGDATLFWKPSKHDGGCTIEHYQLEKKDSENRRQEKRREELIQQQGEEEEEEEVRENESLLSRGTLNQTERGRVKEC